MKKTLQKLKQLNYRHYICIGLTVCFILCALILFQFSFLRFFTSIKNLGVSVGYYFCELLSIPYPITPTITKLFDDRPPYTILPAFPETWEEFQYVLTAFYKLLLDKENFARYFGRILLGLSNLVVVLAVLMPPIVLLVILIGSMFKKENNNYGRISKPLKVVKAISSVTYTPAKKWLIELIEFIKEHSFYWILWLFIWLLNFNIGTIILELFAFLFYFVLSFDVANIYTQVKKLIIDLTPLLKFSYALIIPAIYICQYKNANQM